MEASKMLVYIKEVLKNMPNSWLNLTTHRLDIYDEKLAKTQFLEQFEMLFNDHNSKPSALSELPNLSFFSLMNKIDSVKNKANLIKNYLTRNLLLK